MLAAVAVVLEAVLLVQAVLVVVATEPQVQVVVRATLEQLI